MDPIVQKIADWASSKWPQINDINTQKGGWEGWAQVELYWYLRNNPLPGPFSIAREVRCYADQSLSADLVISYTDANGTDRRMIIELKCETDSDQQNQGKGLVPVTFISRVISESATVMGNQLCNILQQLLYKVMPIKRFAVLGGLYNDRTTCDYWVIGISASNVVRAGAQAELAAGGRFAGASQCIQIHELNPGIGSLVLYTAKN